MNIVDLIKGQLAGEVTKQLGGLIGADKSGQSGAMDKMIGAALPTILSGLGGLASSKSGADKLSQAIGGMDSSMFGNLGGLLKSSGSTGGNLLSGLIGGKAIDALSAVVSKFLGIDSGMVKMALGYLTPMILGSVGSSLGGKTDAGSISRLFADQKSNIASALPSGLKFDGVPGLDGLFSNAANAASQAVPNAAPSNLGKILVPLVLLAALAAAAYFIMNPGAKPDPKPVDGGRPAASSQPADGLALPPAESVGLPPAGGVALPPAGGVALPAEGVTLPAAAEGIALPGK